MKAYDLVIKGGMVVSPQGTIRADVGVAGERIVAVGLDLSGKREIDASGNLVLPGVIDAHTHMALPVAGTRSSDDFFTGTRAAAYGGVTTIVDFTVGTHETSIPEEIEARKQEAAASVIDYALHGEVVGWHPGNEAEFRDAVKLGVKTFKFYTAYAASGRSSDSGILYHAFGVLADLDAVALVHCEDDHIIDAILQQMGSAEKGKMASLAQARPPICEGAAIDQVAYLAEQAGMKVHIVHVSSQR
jgi:dihydropyrimidinase